VSIRYALNLAITFAALAQPFIPETAAKITRAFADNDRSLSWPTAVTDALKPGAAIRVPDVLFAKIEDAQVAEWAERFGGGGERN
jgi:methionyl-tRNA synthetase